MAVMLKHLVIFFCALFAFCGAAIAETVIDAGFARTLVTSNGFANSKEDRSAVLDNLSNAELRQLKELIVADMEREAPKIIGQLPVDRRLTHGLLNAIDDRLGELEYDYVLDGRFLDYIGSGASINYYYFKTIQGKAAEVYVSVSTLMPSPGYLENYDDYVRIFVKAGYPDNPAGYVVKIEMMKRPPSVEALEPLDLRGSPSYCKLMPDTLETHP